MSRRRYQPTRDALGAFAAALVTLRRVAEEVAEAGPDDDVRGLGDALLDALDDADRARARLEGALWP